MKIRDYKKEDAQIIAGWIRSEDELYKWSADRFNKYPLSGDDINENYAPQLETGRFIPLTAVDDNGEVAGHFIIRYPRDDDDSSVRFGFVIIDPELRGKGFGKELLRLGVEYVKEHLSATRIDLGVFENNEVARHCYEAVGFTEYAQRACEMPIGTWNCIDMELFIEKSLETQRLLLRRWKDSDAEDLYKYASDPDVGPIAGWPPHQSIDESRDVIKNVLSGKEAYAICLKEDGKAVGAIELKLNGHTDMTDRDDECEMGYWLGKPFWGRGIMPEAVKEMLRHAFDDCGMQKVWIGYYEGNMKSKRVQEKCGFKYQWRSEGVDVPLMHEKRTGHVSLMTKEDWQAVRRTMKRELGIARCGLACCLCSENVTCKGCKREGFKELSWCKDAEWCEVRRCGIDKNLNGCYECTPAECHKGLYAEKIKPRAFAEFARRYGIEELLDCLERNEQAGIVYHREGIMGDYDDFDDLEELIDFIRTGKKMNMELKSGIVISEHCYLHSGPGEAPDRNQNGVEDEIFAGWAVRSLDEKAENGWIRVETHYGYEGYIPVTAVRWCGLAELNERQDRTRFFRIGISEADLLSEPKVQGLPLELMIKGSFVELLEKDLEDGWVRVRTGAGREGYTRSWYLEERRDNDRYFLDTRAEDPHKKRFFAYQQAILDGDEKAIRDTVVRSAERYLGTQYRWGGKSSQGLDCSGLVFMSYLEQGILLHRDACMPEEYPMHEITKEELKKGDVIFFPGHVTIYMGDGRYIHSTAHIGDGCVVISSLDPESGLYRPDLEGKIEGYGSIF